jgi:hypothetical protein
MFGDGCRVPEPGQRIISKASILGKNRRTQITQHANSFDKPCLLERAAVAPEDYYLTLGGMFDGVPVSLVPYSNEEDTVTEGGGCTLLNLPI